MNGAPSFMIAGRLIALFRIQFEGNHWYPSMAGWRSGFQTPADLLRAVAQHRASGQPWRPAWIRGGEKDVQVLDVPHQVGNWDDGYTNVPWGVDGPLAVTEDGRAVKPAKRPAFSFAPQNTWFYEPISARLLDESALTGEQEYSLLQYVSQLDQSNRPTQLVTA
ncbi:hypothetical protein [Pseudarthrobacter chlorophenolicus]|nr:hypothetical protein [Pseudarthrobacter chlorophenolicus]